MNVHARTSAARLLAAALAAFVASVLAHQQTVSAQGANPQKMEDAFLNIKSLSGEPADQLNPTMVLFEAALGVGCGFCHDNDATKRELDTKPQKQIARQMIEMVNTINKTSFNGQKKVSCFTCHAGRAVPIGVPNVIHEELPPAYGEDYLASLPPAPGIPDVTAPQLLDKYAAVSGGAGAVQKTPALMAVGTVTQRRTGRDFPSQQIEISSKPGMELIVTKTPQAENLLAYSPAGSWAKAGNAPVRDLRNAEGDAAKLEDAFNLPTQLKQMLVEPRVGRPEVVDGREMYTVTGRTQYLPRVTAYFEKESGMLRRLRYHIDTPFGPYPTQVDYRDFRDVGGRRVPHQWVISQTRNREFTWALQNVRALAVEDSKFAKPAPATAAR